MTDSHQAAKSPIELPMASWVKGGTTSWRHDQELARQKAEAEERRKLDDAHQRIVVSNPVEARMRSMNFDGDDAPLIVLHCTEVEEYREQYIECEFKRVATQDGLSFEMMLVLVCLRCVFSNGRAMSQSQMQIRESNRKIWLDPRRAGEIWVNPNTGRARTLAGTITTADWCACSVCGWRFRLDNSMIRVR